MTEAGRADISVDQGADFAVQVVWTDNSGTPYQVVHPIRMQARSSDGVAVLTATSLDETQDNGDAQPSISYNTSLGIIQLNLTSDQTAAMPAGDYFYDLLATYAASAFTVDTGVPINATRVQKLLYGKFVVEGSVTKGV